MDEPRAAKISRQHTNIFVRVPLWKQFRIALLENDLNITEGIEQAIEEWLKENS